MHSIADPSRAPTGRIVYDVFRHGKLIEHVEEQNLVVNGSRGLLASLLGGTTANKFISQVGFGSSATAPQSANTTLTTPFLKAVDSVTFPAFGQVQFNFSLANSEANGLSISEFGLLSGDGTLFSRRIRATPIVKDNTISFTSSWLITF